MRTPEPRRIGPSPFAGALALFLAGAQVAAIAHLAFVRHEPCPEHGLSVHASTHRSQSPGPRGTLAPALSQVGVEEGSEHAHEHCLAACLHRDAAYDDGHRQFLVGATDEPLASTPIDGPAAAAGVWRVAPKQSPPPLDLS